LTVLDINLETTCHNDWGAENAGKENAGVEYAGVDSRGIVTDELC